MRLVTLTDGPTRKFDSQYGSLIQLTREPTIRVADVDVSGDGRSHPSIQHSNSPGIVSKGYTDFRELSLMAPE